MVDSLFFEMADATRKRNSRRAHRIHANRILKGINDILVTIDINDEVQVTKLRGLHDNYRQQFDRIKSLDDEIIELIAEENVEEELLKSLEENDVFYEVLRRVECCLGKVVVESAPSIASSSSVSSRSSSDVRVKLPKLELRKFDGTALNWQTFWDQFDSSIHSKESISDIDKFTYLRSLLCESASDCISGLTLTVPNYQEAIKILNERYANPQIIISAHMEALVKLPAIKNMNNVVGLRKIYDRVESSIRNLKSLGISPTSYGSLLTPMLTEKLPPELRMIIARKFTNNIWDLEELLIYFKEELQAKERCLSIGVNNTVNNVGNININNNEKRNYGETTTSTFLVNGKSACVFCRLPHSPSKCTKITSVNARRGVLRKFARCFLCLKTGHMSKDCVSEYKCNKCTKRHHISLCEHEENRTVRM